jgi:aspartyl protease family protein
MRYFFVMVICICVISANAQQRKTFAELKNEGNEAIRNKDYPRALDLYEQALVKLGNQPPDDISMIYNMGICALSSKNYEKALKYFDQSIALNFKRVKSLVYKAEVYRLTNNDSENLKALETAFSISTGDPEVKSKLALYYVRQANIYYTKGRDIIIKVNGEVTAGKFTTSDESYKYAEKQAVDEFRKALPLVERALVYDADNSTARQLKDACEEAITPSEHLVTNFSSGSNVIKMKKEGGIYLVPIMINGVEMDFIFDTGASVISISQTEAMFLLKQGRLNKEDFIGTDNYMDANGGISIGITVNFKTVVIGNKILKNVQATIVGNLQAPLLLGQSALSRFGKISIDYDRNEITFN